ncbi:hypothetical protein PI126_g7141 [Phytophthora idaei]|nr:hypothetical protein PI126_g7141 [Phytophthora idaei]
MRRQLSIRVVTVALSSMTMVWTTTIQCEEEVLGRCGSVKRCRLLATDYHALAVQQHSVCSPAPFRDDSRAATTEKTCILGEKFLMSPQSELTISNS